MLTLPVLLSIAAVFVAATALLIARRVSKRLERLTETYWELRYEYGQLRARVGRLEPEQPGESVPPPATGGASTNFIPLSSLKR